MRRQKIFRVAASHLKLSGNSAQHCRYTQCPRDWLHSPEYGVDPYRMLSHTSSSEHREKVKTAHSSSLFLLKKTWMLREAT
jgi:hypothetical protein